MKTETGSLLINVLSKVSLALAFLAAVMLLVTKFYAADWMVVYFAKRVLFFGALTFIVLRVLVALVGERRSTEITKNALLIGTSLVVVLILCEFTARWIYRDVTSTGDNRSYFCLHSNSYNKEMNSYGYRENKFSTHPNDGVYRIAVIGDSFAFGQGIKEKERFSNLLGSKLNAGKERFEVLNFGVPGAETVDELQTLKKVVVLAHPDFVLLQWFINDFEGHNKSGRPSYYPLVPFQQLRKLLYEHSALYYLLNQKWCEIQTSVRERMGTMKSYDEYMKARFGDPGSKEVRDVLGLLNEFFEICRKKNIGIGVVLFPALDKPLSKGYAFGYLHQYVIDLCHKEGVPVLDLRESLLNVKKMKPLWANPFDHHPSRLANQIAAQRMMEAFGATWYGHRLARTLQ